MPKRENRSWLAQNALLPLYRKELRIVLLEYLQWMTAMKKDFTFQKVMETQKDLKVKIQMDLIGYNRQNWPLISGNSCLIDCLWSNPFHKMKTKTTVFCSQYKCISNRYLECCSIGVYFFVKGTSVLLFIAS